MNDIQFASSIRQALDESTQLLPWRVTHRLERARKTALEDVRDDARRASDASRASRRVIVPVPSQGHLSHDGWSQSASGFADRPRARLGWRLMAILLPAAVLIAGLFGFSELESSRSAAEVANLETTAVLADEVPIAAYADRGFGVFLKNSKP